MIEPDWKMVCPECGYSRVDVGHMTWDRVLELMDNDGYATGRIDYRSGGTGRLTANFNGTRYSIYIERVESEE
jgi:hypothetical protein